MSRIDEQILILLSKHFDYIQAENIAKELDVSTKTVYRAIKRINQTKEVVLSHRGLGYKLNITDIKVDSKNEIDKRQNRLAIRLLFAQPKQIKALDLLEEYHISESVLNNDLKRIDDLLKKYDLTLSRKSALISVQGNEWNIRQVLNYCLLQKSHGLDNWESLEQIFPDIKEKDKNFIAKQIALIEEILAIKVLDPYTINIFSHFYILMSRMKKGSIRHELSLNSTMLEEQVQQYEKYYQLACQIIQNFSDYLQISIPMNEALYLLQYLIAIRYNKHTEASQEHQRLIDYFAKGLVENYPFDGITTKGANDLKEELKAHLQPMINRLFAQIVVVNPLLADIRTNYETEFNKVKEIVEKLCLQADMTLLSDDEISFLTLYIVKTVERYQRRLKVILMCSTGIGTSQLLKQRIAKYFPEIEVVDVISSFSFKSKSAYYSNQADIVISTIAVPQDSVLPVVVVSPLFNDFDRKRVAEYVRNQD